MQKRHEFALFYPLLTSHIKNITNDQLITITDPTITGRITSILRLRPGEEIIFFDAHISAHCSLYAVGKKEIQCVMLKKYLHQKLKPSITFILPLLKKDDFETALYSLVELGANTIQLVTTEKTQRSWGTDKEYDRCQRIMIAAAEQSKNFSLPELLSPIPLKTYVAGLKTQKGLKIYFDPHGNAAFTILKGIDLKKPDLCTLMVGPEGDLTADEKSLLQNQGFEFCQLTPTVLRSISAISIGLGMVRTLIR